MTLYLPVGPPASGKTYLLQQAIEKGIIDQQAVASTDALRVKLTGQIYDQSANGSVFAIMDRIVDERLKRGLPVWQDATNLLPAWRAKAVGSAQRYGVPIVFIMMTANDKLCRERNAERDPPIPDDIMEQMFQYRRELTASQFEGGKFIPVDIFLRQIGAPC